MASLQIKGITVVIFASPLHHKWLSLLVNAITVVISASQMLNVFIFASP
jgi:hypothetical protein